MMDNNNFPNKYTSTENKLSLVNFYESQFCKVYIERNCSHKLFRRNPWSPIMIIIHNFPIPSPQVNLRRATRLLNSKLVCESGNITEEFVVCCDFVTTRKCTCHELHSFTSFRIRHDLFLLILWSIPYMQNRLSYLLLVLLKSHCQRA